MLRTVGKDGLDLGLVALLQLDDRPSSEGGEHDGAMSLVSSSGLLFVTIRRC